MRSHVAALSAMALSVAFSVTGCGAASTSPVPPSTAAAVPITTAPPEPVASATAADESATPTATTVPLAGRIVFARKTTGDWTLFLVDADGSDQHRLVSETGEIPRWSPDASRISYARVGPDGRVTTVVVGADGTGSQTFDLPSPTLNLGCAAWSPDGGRLACEGWDDLHPEHNGVWTISSADGGDAVRVTTSPNGGHDIPGDFSPDGAQISFVRSTEEEHGRLFVVGSTGGEPTPLSTLDTFSSAWSPDGRTILVDGPEQTLAVVSVANASVTKIVPQRVNGVPAAVFGGRWSPAGDRMVFAMAAPGAGTTDLYTMRPDGTDLRIVSRDPGQDEFGDWTP